MRTQKKAGRFPIRGNEGPAKNLRLKRRKNAQQDTKTQCFLCWFFKFSRKRFSKLGGFSLPFAEITVVMSLKPDSRWSGMRFQTKLYLIFVENQAVFLFVSDY